MLDDIIKLLEVTKRENDNEYKIPILNIVTSEIDEGVKLKGDEDGRRDRVTVMKYYHVRPKEYFEDGRHEEHNGKTYKKHIEKIPPRKFYSKTQVYNYASYLNKIAGRTITSDEMNLLLKTISRGEPYKLTCLIDITDEVKGQTVWRTV